MSKKTISLQTSKQVIKQFLKQGRAHAIKVSLYLLTTPTLKAGCFLSRLYTTNFGNLQLSWYDHIYAHLSGPENWHWLERGILASDCIRQGDRVLDLCCGGGSYSGIFFSPKARFVDAIDFSSDAIRVARKRWACSNLTFHVADVLRAPFPHAQYDVVVLNAALEYFSAECGHKLLEKVSSILTPQNGILFGCTPIWKEQRAYNFGQVSSMTSLEELEEFLRAHFNDVVLCQSRETTRLVYYFRCKSVESG